MSPFRISDSANDRSADIPADGSLVVGRAVTSDLTVFDPTVSRKHAELVAGSDGVTVTDLGSSNGTFVNGARIYQPQFAREGDVVTFGKRTAIC